MVEFDWTLLAEALAEASGDANLTREQQQIVSRRVADFLEDAEGFNRDGFEDLAERRN